MSSPETPELIRRRLFEAIGASAVEVVDESRRHAGHEGARGGGHYAVTVVAAAFEGLPPIARHRLVYRALAAEMSGSIHALSLSALTPAEFAARPGGGSGARPRGGRREP